MCIDMNKNFNLKIIDGITCDVKDLLQRQINSKTKGIGLIICQRLIEMLPDNPYIYCYQGYLLDEIGREEEALCSFDKVLELGLRDSTIYGFRGDLLFSLERLEEALLSYNEAILIDSNHANYYARIGGIHSILGNFDHAITQLQKAIKLEPKEFLYQFILDLILEEQGKS